MASNAGLMRSPAIAARSLAALLPSAVAIRSEQFAALRWKAERDGGSVHSPQTPSSAEQ